MTDYYDPENENIKPGGNRAFGGGKINKHRKIHDVPPELIQAAQKTFGLLVRSGWVYNKHNHEFGVIFNNIVDILNHGDLKPFLNLHLNHISVSTVDRARRVASNVDIHKYPSFLSVPQHPTLKMLRKYSFDEAVNLLEINGADLYLQENDTKGIEHFQYLFKLLLKGELALLPGDVEAEDASSEEDNNPAIHDTDSPFSENETEPVIKDYVSYVESLDQFHGDMGHQLDQHKVYELTDILVKTSNLLLKFGPTMTRDKKFQKIHDFIAELHDTIFESLLDDDSNPDDNEAYDNTEPTTEDYLDSFYFKKLINHENAQNRNNLS